MTKMVKIAKAKAPLAIWMFLTGCHARLHRRSPALLHPVPGGTRMTMATDKQVISNSTARSECLRSALLGNPGAPSRPPRYVGGVWLSAP